LKRLLDEDISEKSMMGMLDPFFAGTLTLVKTIETLIESAFATVLRTIRSSGLFLFFLVRTVMSCCIA
jgi:hypothetical protein